ncbi:MAG TPA: DUF2142 domain-containing protein [Acidimicrobiales bacterium]
MNETTTIAAPRPPTDAGTTARRLPEVPWARCFVALAMVFGVFLAMATPPLQEHDAVGHLVRVDRMSRGTFVEPLDDRGRTSAPIDGCLSAFIDHHTARGTSDTSLDLRGNWTRVPCGSPSETPIPTSSLTSPVPYVSNAVGYTAAKVAGGGIGVRVLAARLASLAVYVVAVWGALRVAPKGRAVLFAVAILPSSLALAAGVHADSTGIWAAVLSVALTLRVRERPSRAVLAGLAASLVVLALSKNLYGPFVLLVLLVPAAAFPDLWARRRYVATTAAVVAVPLAAWSSYAARNHYVVPFLGIDSREAQSYVIRHPLAFLHSAWNGLWDPFFRQVTLPGFVEVLGGMRPARVGHVYGDLPPLALFGVAAVVLAVAVLADPGPTPQSEGRTRRQVAVVTGVIAAAGVVLIWLGMALTANPPGAGTLRWAQGRYFIPLVALLAFAAGRRVRHQPALALTVPAGALFLLLWVGSRVFAVFY